ncbi:MAG: YARHG domain-containing protein [Candidatus Eremiobacteraeota bacterium]|nr:YARHG domain-containing protein [Candidatus Eremiobacteraeota bacterium]
MKHAVTLLLALALSLPVLAQEAAVRQALARSMPGASIDSVRSSGNWALCGWSQGDSAGMALLHRYGKSWEVAQSGGGVMGLTEIALLGVPQGNWMALMGGQISAEEKQRAQEALAGPNWTWLTQKQGLSAQDLESYTAWELTLMRNEVFALHGRKFSDPELNACFTMRSWYQPRSDYRDSSLTPTEKANVEFISAYQKKTGKL